MTLSQLAELAIIEDREIVVKRKQWEDWSFAKHMAYRVVIDPLFDGIYSTDCTGNKGFVSEVECLAANDWEVFE